MPQNVLLTIGGAGVDWHKNSFEIQSAFDGEKMVDLNLDGGSLATTGTISQSFPTVVGQDYLLTFYLAGPNTGFPNPRQVRVNIAGIEQIFSEPASDNLALVWGGKVLGFVATDTTTTLQFSSVDGTGFWGPFLDEVSVTGAAVPEPSAMASAATGVLMILGYAWRRRSGDLSPARFRSPR